MNKTKDLEAVLYKDKKISVAFLSEVYIFLPTKSILGSVLTESATFYGLCGKPAQPSTLSWGNSMLQQLPKDSPE